LGLKGVVVVVHKQNRRKSSGDGEKKEALGEKFETIQWTKK